MCLHVEGAGVVPCRGVPKHCRRCRPAVPKVGTPCCCHLRCWVPLPVRCIAAWTIAGSWQAVGVWWECVPIMLSPSLRK